MFLVILRILYSLFFLRFLSSILVKIIDKIISLNLIKIILKFGFILITYSKSIEFGINVSVGYLKKRLYRSSSNNGS